MFGQVSNNVYLFGKNVASPCLSLCMMVDGGFAGLLHLLISRNPEKTAIFAEQGTCLLEMEGDVGIDALLSDV